MLLTEMPDGANARNDPWPDDLLPLAVPDGLLQGRTVRRCERLNSERCVQVARLLLGGGEVPWSTLIGKSYDAAQASPALARIERHLFETELANYRFLDARRDRFARLPRLLVEGDDAFFLEDLGPFRALPTDAEMMEAIASTFLLLHGSTEEDEAGYAASHGAAAADRRRALADACLLAPSETLFEHGAAAFLRWCAILLPAALRLFEPMLARARGTVEQDFSYRAFIHNDLSSRRQSVLVRGEFFLLDFEHGQYGHRLLDLAMVMIGKLELAGKTIPLHIHPSLPARLATVYRRQWEARRGAVLPNADWNRHLLDAMLYHVMTVVSHILLRAKNFPLGSLVTTLHSLLGRFATQIEVVDDTAAMRDAIDALIARLAIV